MNNKETDPIEKWLPKKQQKVKYNSDTYCDVFFNEIYTNPNGLYRFCCHAQAHDHSENRMSTHTHGPFEWFKSDYMEDVRTDILSGIRQRDCALCYKMEKTGGDSPRTRKHNLHNYTDIDKRQIKLNLSLSNACNLGCYMCGPENSTTRAKELQTVFGKEHGYAQGITGLGFALKRKKYEKLKNDILENIHLVNSINLIGGEPMMIPEVWDLLDSIPEEHAKEIILCWITNMTKVGYKNYNLDDTIKKFGKTHFNISCDHFGEKESWIRYPIDISSFENNLRKYKKHIAQIQVTVGILNGSDLLEIRDYYNKEFGLYVNFDNLVIGPEYLSIINYPQRHKEYLIDRYSNAKDPEDFKVMLELMTTFNNSTTIATERARKYREGIEYCQTLSDHRKFQFKDIWKDSIPWPK